MNEWTVVFERELRGKSLRRAVGVCADRELSDTELEQHARACLPWRERGEYRLLKIRRETPEGTGHTIVQGALL